MKAVVFHGLGDIRLDDVPEPTVQGPRDAVIRITASAICGTDLHMIRGTLPGMKEGTILGHEAVGIVETVGPSVGTLRKGDRVLVGSTICCGRCSYCEAGYYSQCDHANPNGAQAGTAFFGGPASTGSINGLQAEYARIPFADSTMIKLPDEVSDDEAILISDIFPTGYFGADKAEIKKGDTVCVFGCGPVGLFAILSARLFGAGRIFAVDHLPDRLAKAAELGAEPVDFDKVSPTEFVKEQTKGLGVMRAIDAVGVDAIMPRRGPAYQEAKAEKSIFKQQMKEIAKDGTGETWSGQWAAGDAPSQVLNWGVQALAKAGTFSIIGVYPETMMHFPIGIAMNKNLTLQMGNCPHRKYLPQLVELVRAGEVQPTKVLSEQSPLTDALAAYKAFDKREAGWIKVELKPVA